MNTLTGYSEAGTKAFVAGVVAYDDPTKARADNPHTEGSEEHTAWDDGWECAIIPVEKKKRS